MQNSNEYFAMSTFEEEGNTQEEELLCNEANITICKFSERRIKTDAKSSFFVLIGLMYIEALITWIAGCFGVFFREKMEAKSASSTLANTIVTVCMFVFNGGCMVAPSLAKQFGVKRITLICVVISSLSFVLLSLDDSIVTIFIAYSITLGLCCGILQTICLLVVPIYFEKYRRSALVAVTIGMASGEFITPLIVTTSRKMFGYYGSQLIYAAFLLQGCVVGTALISKSKQTIHFEGPSRKLLEDYNEEQVNSKVHLAASKASINAKKLKLWLVKTKASLKIKKLFIMGLVRGLFHASSFSMMIFLPFALSALNQPQDLAPWLISMNGICSAAIRIPVILLVDSQWCCRQGAFFAATVAAGLTNFVVVFFLSSANQLTPCFIVLGISKGIFVSLYYSNLIDIVGPDLYSDSLVVNAIMLALSDAPLAFVLGIIRDWSGSYSLVLALCGAIQTFSSIVLAVFLCQHKSTTSHI